MRYSSTGSCGVGRDGPDNMLTTHSGQLKEDFALLRKQSEAYSLPGRGPVRAFQDQSYTVSSSHCPEGHGSKVGWTIGSFQFCSIVVLLPRHILDTTQASSPSFCIIRISPRDWSMDHLVKRLLHKGRGLSLNLWKSNKGRAVMAMHL